MSFAPNSKVIVSQKQTYSNSSVLTAGEVVSIQGDRAIVQLEGDAVVRSVPLTSLQDHDAVLGSLSNSPHEQSIIDMSPKTRR